MSPAQLAGVSPSTKLVTTHGGGDRRRFERRARRLCARIRRRNSRCRVAASTAKLQALGPQLVGLYSTIAATLPEARVVVLNYPKLFNPGVAPLGDLVNTATDALNAVIQVPSRRPATPDHPRRCDAGVRRPRHRRRLPYIAFDQANLLAPANFHPNALGNALGYTRALANDGVLRH